MKEESIYIDIIIPFFYENHQDKENTIIPKQSLPSITTKSEND